MTSKILDITIISPNYRINLPESARELLEVKKGDRVAIIEEEKEIKIRRA